MGSRYTKGIPEFVYLVGEGEDWISGPFVKPQAGRKNRKFKLVEVTMDEKKPKGKKMNMEGVERAIGELMNEEKIKKQIKAKENGKS